MASEFHSSCSIRALPGTILPQESNTGGQAQGLVLTGHRACSHQDTQTLHRGLGSLGELRPSTILSTFYFGYISAYVAMKANKRVSRLGFSRESHVAGFFRGKKRNK